MFGCSAGVCCMSDRMARDSHDAQSPCDAETAPQSATHEANAHLSVAECTTPPSATEFFLEYVAKNVPLVMRGAAGDWAALGWSAESLARDFGEEVVSVAPLQVHGPHAYCDKWLETAEAWDHSEPEPDFVDASQLLVVSASRAQIRLSRFLSMLRTEKSPVAAAFYADGAGNLAHSFPYLHDAFSSPPVAEQLLHKRTDLWIGGRSVSRMHYDNLDNLFGQAVGSKTFVLSPPDAGAPHVRGRLRKAARSYTHPGCFSREGGAVLRETVLNYMGVDRPPSMPTVSVTLRPGDMLYLPFGWWHEVHAHPDDGRGGMCASISHFYHPFWCRIGGQQTTELGPSKCPTLPPCAPAPSLKIPVRSQ